MPIAYVLVNAEAGQESAVHARLLKVPEVRELMPLFGEYDFICKIDAPDLDDLGQTILTKIRTIGGVAQTRTLTATKL